MNIAFFDPVIDFVVLGIVALIVVIWVVHKKRTNRKKYELARHIRMILDPNGCENALSRWNECFHISTYYGHPLHENGFDGDYQDLEVAANMSLNRYLKRERAVNAQIADMVHA